MELISGREFYIMLRRKGITQTEISKVFDIQRSQLSLYFNDHRPLPSKLLIGIILYAGIPVQDLIAVPPPDRVEPPRPSRTYVDFDDAEYTDIPQLAAEPDAEYGYKGIETLLERMRTETRVEILREQVVSLTEQVLSLMKNKN